MRELGVPHLVVAFDLKVAEICRNNRIPVHTDDEGTGERYSFYACSPRIMESSLRLGSNY